MAALVVHLFRFDLPYSNDLYVPQFDFEVNEDMLGLTWLFRRPIKRWRRRNATALCRFSPFIDPLEHWRLSENGRLAAIVISFTCFSSRLVVSFWILCFHAYHLIGFFSSSPCRLVLIVPLVVIRFCMLSPCVWLCETLWDWKCVKSRPSRRCLWLSLVLIDDILVSSLGPHQGRKQSAADVQLVPPFDYFIH